MRRGSHAPQQGGSERRAVHQYATRSTDDALTANTVDSSSSNTSTLVASSEAATRGGKVGRPSATEDTARMTSPEPRTAVPPAGSGPTMASEESEIPEESVSSPLGSPTGSRVLLHPVRVGPTGRAPSPPAGDDSALPSPPPVRAHTSPTQSGGATQSGTLPTAGQANAATALPDAALANVALERHRQAATVAGMPGGTATLAAPRSGHSLTPTMAILADGPVITMNTIEMGAQTQQQQQQRTSTRAFFNAMSSAATAPADTTRPTRPTMSAADLAAQFWARDQASAPIYRLADTDGQIQDLYSRVGILQGLPNELKQLTGAVGADLRDVHQRLASMDAQLKKLEGGEALSSRVDKLTTQLSDGLDSVSKSLEAFEGRLANQELAVAALADNSPGNLAPAAQQRVNKLEAAVAVLERHAKQPAEAESRLTAQLERLVAMEAQLEALAQAVSAISDRAVVIGWLKDEYTAAQSRSTPAEPSPVAVSTPSALDATTSSSSRTPVASSQLPQATADQQARTQQRIPPRDASDVLAGYPAIDQNGHLLAPHRAPQPTALDQWGTNTSANQGFPAAPTQPDAATARYSRGDVVPGAPTHSVGGNAARERGKVM